MTAEDLLNKIAEKSPYNLCDAPITIGTEAMIEFAKYHVKKALESSHRNMQLPEEDLEFTLEAYPESNIK